MDINVEKDWIERIQEQSRKTINLMKKRNALLDLSITVRKVVMDKREKDFEILKRFEKEMREPEIIDELGEAAEVGERYVSDRCCIEKCEKFGMKYFDEYEKERVARYKSIRATVDKYRKILNVELPAYVTTAEALKSEFPSNSENNKEYLKFWKVQERELDYLRKVLLSTNPSKYLLDGSGDHTVFQSSATNQNESPTNVQDKSAETNLTPNEGNPRKFDVCEQFGSKYIKEQFTHEWVHESSGNEAMKDTSDVTDQHFLPEVVSYAILPPVPDLRSEICDETNNNAVVVNSTFPTTYDKLSSGILPIKWLPAESIRNPKESRNKVYQRYKPKGKHVFS